MAARGGRTWTRRARLVAAACAAALCAWAGSAQALTVHVGTKLDPRRDVRVTFAAPALPEGGYYYAVLVLRHYRHYTAASPPPCAVSSDMEHTDYGYPDATGTVLLRVSPVPSRTGHWCRGAAYEAAIYAVPHPPPCNAAYPCSSETPRHECAGVGPGCVHGVLPYYAAWKFPEALPSPRADGTKIGAYFRAVFRKR